jgi:hypothetical protein
MVPGQPSARVVIRRAMWACFSPVQALRYHGAPATGARAPSSFRQWPRPTRPLHDRPALVVALGTAPRVGDIDAAALDERNREAAAVVDARNAFALGPAIPGGVADAVARAAEAAEVLRALRRSRGRQQYRRRGRKACCPPGHRRCLAPTVKLISTGPHGLSLGQAFATNIVGDHINRSLPEQTGARPRGADEAPRRPMRSCACANIAR